MSKTLDAKINYIIVNSDYNDLSFEDRKTINKYKDEQRILTILQMINKNKEDTTEAWRRKQRKWLENCVNTYNREYRYPKGENDE